MKILLLLGLAFTGTARAESRPARDSRFRMERIANALEEYRVRCGIFPETEAGLAPLLEEVRCQGSTRPPILHEIDFDGWGRFFLYESDGRTFRLSSLGRDGLAGGVGADSDILIER